MKSKMLKTLVIGALISSMSTAMADEVKHMAIKKVKDAVAFAGQKGKEAVIAELSKSDGIFAAGSEYVFAYDENGVMAAHPKNPRLIGQNLLEVPDVNGKLFRKDIIDQVKSKGVAQVEYSYRNPETKEIEVKETYCKPAAGLVLCAGYYKG